jgi:rhodanese-related sulfurtransferase
VTGRAPWALVLAAALALSAAPGATRAGHDSVPEVVSLRSDYLKRLMDAREAVVLVDMRTPREYRAGHLPGAISVPITELDRRFKEIPRAPRVVLYCECAREDIATAFVFLKTQGYANHAVLEDGFDGWLKRRYPLTR